MDNMKTPRRSGSTRSMSKSMSNLNNKTSEGNQKYFNISEILKTNLRIFRSSPLYNFQESRLKIYGRKLKEQLAAFHYGTDTSNFSSNFSVHKLELDESYDVIQISVTVGVKKYNACWLSSSDDRAKEEFPLIKHYPLLLVNAGEKMSKEVHNIICKFFDCDIQPVHLPFSVLITLFASMSHAYINKVPQLKSEIITLYYKIPGTPASDNINISMPLSSTATTLAVLCHDFDEDAHSPKLILGFYERIINHILNVHHIDLHNGELYKIVFPHFTVFSGGSVKCSNAEALNQILKVKNDFIHLRQIPL